MKACYLFPVFLLLFGWAAAQTDPVRYNLWENGAPGFENLKDIPESAQDWWVRDIHNPSVTLFTPENPNGTFVLVCPGGGFRNLVYNSEGVKAAAFLNSLGITVGVLKYRLFRQEDSPYTDAQPKQDVIRAMRFVRSKASEWKIDPDRVGAMGFSAGGEVVNYVAFDENSGDPTSTDPIEKFPAQPNFIVQVYPGPLATPEKVSKDAPPAFLVAANQDECCSGTIIQTMIVYREAGADVELHMFSKDEHAFNMGDRSKFVSINHWPERLKEWFEDQNYFKKEN